ncbi:MAG: AbrB/MazE/SpoVT family DNA-binding domain-containing protein [Coriobacteriales bacterium]|jgi:antitoxin component of MazEF toxin-antitoxin module|nr:AbrB/MazE/SpoVT family DNA-binding domain-containing protein [Coriobacteriales bacterium]
MMDILYETVRPGEVMMATGVTITKWGNSKGVRIPAPVLRELGLDVGDRVTVSVLDGGLLLRRELNRLERIQSYCGTLSNEDARQMEEALRDCERIDVDEW